MFAFLKDTNTLTFYDGSSLVPIGEGDITGVTITTAATSGLSGGATATSGIQFYSCDSTCSSNIRNSNNK